MRPVGSSTRGAEAGEEPERAAREGLGGRIAASIFPPELITGSIENAIRVSWRGGSTIRCATVAMPHAACRSASTDSITSARVR